MNRQLYDALEESIAQGTTERSLRLLVQGIARFPLDSQLRRQTVQLLAAQGLAIEVVPVLRRIVEIDRAQGDILGLVATARLAEGMDVQSDDAWQAIAELLARRSSAPPALAKPAASPTEPAPDRPPLRLDELMSVTAELAGRPVEGLAEQPVAQLPLLGQLSDEPAMSLLRELRLTIAPKNARLVHTLDAVAWLIAGAFADPGQPAHWLPAGTLITCHAPAPCSSTWTLSAPTSAWQTLCANPEIQSALQNALLNARAAAMIGRSDFARAVGPAALRQFLGHALAFSAPSGIIRPSGQASGGVGLLVDGALKMSLLHNRNPIHIATLRPGDTFGAESGGNSDVALLELTSPEPVGWIWLPPEHQAAWLSEHPAAMEFLAAQATTRSTALRLLKDSLAVEPGDPAAFDDSELTPTQGARQPTPDSGDSAS